MRGQLLMAFKFILTLFAIAVVMASGTAFSQPNDLADQLMEADAKQFAEIFPKFEEQAERGLPSLIGELDRKVTLDADDVAKEKLAKRQANAAVALMKLGQPEKVLPLLKHSPDPRVRSYLIHRFAPFGADPNVLIKRLDDEPEITIRRALILSLGEFDTSAISLDSRKAVMPLLQKLYCEDADPGLHAASEWLIRKWSQHNWLKQINEEWGKDNDQREKRLESIVKSLATVKVTPQWYVNGQVQTMVVIPGPVEFVMGSPTTEVGRRENEPQHQKQIGRTFSISTKLVTLEQYRKYESDHSPVEEVFARTADLPVVETSWYQAVAYCNWLSKEEGIPEDQWCFEIKGDETKLKANYLSLAGYRLPTEAEIEYATRAGATTARYYGETDELLAKYAWYLKNSQGRTQQVGRLKPNDLGLFDVQGNLWEWCQNHFQPYPTGKDEESAEDQEDDLVVNDNIGRVLRGGGSFGNQSWSMRSAYRNLVPPTTRNLLLGFRLARTMPPVPDKSP